MMDDKQTAAHLREWVAREAKGLHRSHWAWPTDACGYDQHIRFVNWRNAKWMGEQWHAREGATWATWGAFVLDYAERLERGEIAALATPSAAGEAK